MGARSGRDSLTGVADATVAPGAITALIARLAHAPAQEAPPPLVPGTRVGRYEIIRAIGHGGFGTVYEAHDSVLNRLVALKSLHRTEAADPAAAREAEVGARLSHPNIAALYDAGVADGGYGYLVYELLHGETLESRLARGPIPPSRAIAIASQVARALAHAHAHGVIHRDLKPANVLLMAEGDVKVLDFGIALLFGRDAPAGGTPAYMAPEQRRGEPEDAQTDLFALGIVLREMLTGERGDGPVLSSDGVPPRARRVLSALLADHAAARPRSARAALVELEAASRELGTPGARRWPARRVAVVAAVGAVALAVGVTLAVRERLQHPGPIETTAAPALPSIAVLPFANLSPGTDQEYFSDGVAEEILNALVQVDGLRVAGRSSSFAYKGKNESAANIGRALHVSAVLEGSVRKAGPRVRISAQLVATADGFNLWSHTYERDVTDVFAVQDEIAHAVVAALQVKLLPGRPVGAREHLATHPDAYSHYLLGRQLFHLGSPEGYRRAVEAYEKALAIDARYAPAWAGLAIAANYASNFALSGEEFQSLIRRSREAGPRAVAFDPELADGFAARGYVRAMLDHEWAGAEQDLQRAITLSPRDAEIRRLYGSFILAPRGLTAQAIENTRLATELDPGAPLCWNALGVHLMQAGQYANARAPLEKALQLNPDQSFAALNLAKALVLGGDAARALPVAAGAISPGRRLTAIAIVHHSLGQEDESRKALEALTAQYGTRNPYQIATVHAWRGERDQAFHWLDRSLALSDREMFLQVKVDPMLRGLHGDPRFNALLRRMNLPPD